MSVHNVKKGSVIGAACMLICDLYFVAQLPGSQRSWQQLPRKLPHSSRSCTGSQAPGASLCSALPCLQGGALEESLADPLRTMGGYHLLTTHTTILGWTICSLLGAMRPT